MQLHFPPKRRYERTKPHGVRAQKTSTFFFLYFQVIGLVARADLKKTHHLICLWVWMIFRYNQCLLYSNLGEGPCQFSYSFSIQSFGLTTEGSDFEPGNVKKCLFSISTGPALEPAQPPIQWIARAPSQGIQRAQTAN
jgi:hypothetical protein